MDPLYYPITGIEGAFIAPVLVDTADAYSTGEVIECPPNENANWTSTQNSTPFHGNNVKQDDVFGTEISSIVLRLNGISEELDARIRGKSYIAASGRVAGSGGTNPPLYALGLKINKGDSNMVCVWFLKGRFSGGNIVAQTKQDNVTVNMREYTFAASETVKKFTYTDAITGKEKKTGLTWYKGETANAAFSDTGFFSQVQTPDSDGAPAAIALSTIVPAADAPGIAVSANIVLTFNNKIASENVVLIDAAGDIVAAAKSFDATGKILTLDPASNMAAGTLHIVCVAGVVDVYGQELAAATSAFTTA